MLAQENINENPLFFNSLLLFSDKSMETLKGATVAIAGIGGVGSIATEMVIRNGVGHVKVSDIDIYSDVNLNRQIFSTSETLGENKSVAAKDRILKINPNCKVEVFEEGINLQNIEEFCKGVDVLLVQVDKESVKILLHRMAKKMRIPAICGSRSSLEESRWCVTAKLWDYKNNPDLPCYDETNHPEMAKFKWEELTDKILKDYDEKIKEKKKKIFRKSVEENSNLFKSIDKEDLTDRLNKHENYHNRHVCSVIANTAGCLAATSTIRYLLDSPVQTLKIDLW